ncbi:MAG: helix-turn-helix transcriptional regulator [Lachnospiraceae bacterium]|nr:helix-turn-helix transcriptional regulator [Lachnospiraceae bacterium]
MPRNKTQTHERIIEAAREEFLEYGFADASLRRIAAKAGIQVSGLYKHFSNKEEMFAALVDPTIEGFMKLYSTIEEEFNDELKELSGSPDWGSMSETVRAMTYIYSHLDAFKLIVSKSKGSKYEEFIHNLAILEEKATLAYMEELKKKGFKVKDINDKEFHLLVTANAEAIFQAVIHDFTKEEAMHYAKTLEEFYYTAWKAVFGI